MSSILNFIIIDDDSIHNALCNLLISTSISGSNIEIFKNPENGLEFIENNITEDKSKTIILLDIDMPQMTGWDFLNLFNKLDEKTQKQYLIYILSSSINPYDKERAFENNNVMNFLVKPLSQEIIRSISSA